MADTALVQPPHWSILAILVLAAALTASLAILILVLRRQARDRDRLAAAEREKALVLAGISDRVTYLDRELRIVWTNWTDEDGQPHPGHRCHEVIAGRNTHCPGCPAAEALRTGEPCEGVVTGDDGRILRMVAAAVRDEQGRICGVVQTARDITQKRRLAEHLREAQKTEAVGRLAAGVAHDFNNSLQVLLGYAEMLRDQVPPASEAGEYLDAMLRAGEQARDVVSHLLTFSRKQETRCEPLDLAGYVRGQVDALERLLGDRIEIRLDAPADLPAVTADPAQVEQVLLNLCANARDAMPGGGALHLSLETEELDAEEAAVRGAPAAGAYVLLCVRDEGEGIAPEIRHRIFEPFFTTKDVDRGSGLGLATVQGIVTAHRGYIDLESKPRCGTCVRIGWPVGAALRDGQGSPAAMADALPQPGRVLVVEDSQPVRELAVEVLARHGHEVETAADGREALDLLLREGHRFDVVVMDVMLPGLNGWSVYTKASARHPRLRAVFCSGHHPEKLETELRMDIPELEYLQKPYRPAELLASVNALLSRGGLRAEQARG